MTGWLKLTDKQRKATIDQAEQNSGISAKAIEKDWWVTLMLKALFRSAYAGHMVFKGGTSLSKCWKLISRFSEDIDIALDPMVFGTAYIENPSKMYVERLKKKGCAFTSNEMKAELEKELLDLGVPVGMLDIQAAHVPENRPDTDPQTLYVRYPSLYEPNGYIADEVKIEVSVRSMMVPHAKVDIQSILNETNPNTVYGELPFPVEAVEPKKTFLEKLFLLHEEFGRPDISRIRTERMSRHLYDLGKMMHTAIEADALQDHALYGSLINHRKCYSRISWVDYEKMGYASLAFVPPGEVMDIYRQDYQMMKEQMIYEEAIPFDELIEQLKMLQERFRMEKA